MQSAGELMQTAVTQAACGEFWCLRRCAMLRRSAQVAPQMEPSTEDDTDIDIEEPQELCKLRSTQIHSFGPLRSTVWSVQKQFEILMIVQPH